MKTSQSSALVDSIAATSGITMVTVPWEQLLVPVTNVITGVASVLLLKGISWLSKRF